MEAEIKDLLRQVPAFLGKAISAQPLEGGLTNRNYRLETGGETFVLRIAGADTALLGIDRQNEFTCSTLAAAAGVGPEVIAFLPEHSTLVRRFVHGRLLTTDDAREPDVLRRVAESLRRYHNHPTQSGLGAFSPFVAVRVYHGLARKRKVPLPKNDLAEALEIMKGIEDALRTDEPACLCHNDLLPSNFIDDGDSIRIIDWEYAGLGDRFFDLGNLAVNFQLDEQGERAFLACYFGDVVGRIGNLPHERRLQLMRLASDMREAMWGYVQAGISQLYTPAYYLEYGRRHLDRFLAAASEQDVRA